jgi:hypothetical protein
MSMSEPQEATAARRRLVEAARNAAREGGTPEQVEARLREVAREEMRGRAPRMAAAAGAWWASLKRLLAFGALALASSAALALAVEHLHAKPLCERFGAGKGWRYESLGYPYLGRGSGQHGGSATCRFVDSAGRPERISLDKLEPNFLAGLGTSFSLYIEFSFPAFFILLALAASPFLKPLRARP